MLPTNQLDDRALVEALQSAVQGECSERVDALFEKLAKLWRDRILRAAATFARSCFERDEFEAVGLQSLYQACVNVDLSEVSRFDVYALSAIRNGMASDLRRRCSRSSRLVEFVDPCVMPHPVVDADESAINAETDAEIARWRSGLATRDRIIIDSIFWDKETQYSVARRLGISTGRVSQLLHQLLGRARRQLDLVN